MNFSISKRILLAAAGILILFIGVEIGFKLNQFSSLSSVLILPSPSKISLSSSACAGPIQSITQTKPNENLFKVIRVIDGDTIEIESGEHIRYIGIDTPETVDPRKPVQCFGVEASKKNKELVEGKMARLEKDITDRDKYNRLLRYVWVDDLFVNLELVKQGFAYSYSYPPDIKYQDQFIKAQQEAREAKRGLWNACPTDPRVNTSVASQSPSATPSVQNSAPGSCLIKGNISASGEKIYHLSDCGSYAKTQIDEGRGERWFCSEVEARAAGWRKALNCP